MAVIDYLDLATKHIYLAAGVREYHPVDDIYKEIRTLRHTNEEYRGNHMPITASGNVAKGGGKFTPRLATFNCGWKIVPENVSHVLFVTGEQITEGGESGPACFDLEPLSPTSKVIIQYEPPSAEVIEAGSAVTEQDKADIAGMVGVLLAAEHEETRESLDEIKHSGGTYEPEKESLEAIRSKLDEMTAVEIKAIKEVVDKIAAGVAVQPRGSFKV